MPFNIAIPEAFILSTRQTSKEFEAEAKKAIALKFYIDEKLSLGQAAELACLSELGFILYLGENSASVFRFNSDDCGSELLCDVQNAERFANG
ncbi:MAG: UPF0175 family protein [Oscillospiraceae bacterium]|nr:UPF0175 family protein [Oscillospiraceae bacterium]